MVLAGVESEIEPFGAVSISFEISGAIVEIKINVLEDIAHDCNHKYIISHQEFRARRRRYLRDSGR